MEKEVGAGRSGTEPYKPFSSMIPKFGVGEENSWGFSSECTIGRKRKFWDGDLVNQHWCCKNTKIDVDRYCNLGISRYCNLIQFDILTVMSNPLALQRDQGSILPLMSRTREKSSN